MVEQLKATKWYWYIPIISIFFSFKMAQWVLEGQNNDIRAIRFSITIILLSLVNAFFILGFIMKILHL